MSWASNWEQDLTFVDTYTSSHDNYQRSVPDSTSSIKHLTNLTLEYCMKIYENYTKKLQETHTKEFCRVAFDGILCWPPTPVNETAVKKCFSELNNIKYNDTQNVTRGCLENGNWSRVNYIEACKEIVPEDTTTFYYFFGGYTLSLITLSLAITILTHFKELRCLRNKIHLHFMWAHLLNHIMWIITCVLAYNFQMFYGFGDISSLCFFCAILLQYSYVTTFFWMLVEGLYLYVLVVKTLTYDNLSFRFYIGIGWGLPLIIIIIWTVGRSIVHSMADITSVCPWFYMDTKINLIFEIPLGVVIFLNFAFLISIMCVLVTKLRSAHRIEAQQYYKAAKALLVLNPLLGTTYVFTFYSPERSDNNLAYIFECARAILLSTQGFVVALFYCFRNAEVQNTIIHHFHNWKASKTLGHSQTRNSSRSKHLTRRSTEWTLVHTDETDFDGRTPTIS